MDNRPDSKTPPAAASLLALSIALASALVACRGAGRTAADPAAAAARAEALTIECLVVDTHIDVPYRLSSAAKTGAGGPREDISQRTEGGDFDWIRAKQGGLDAAFMSIYVPASYEGKGAKAFADGLIDMVESFERENPGKFAVARSSSDVRRIAREGKVALPLGMENGAPIEGDLANLRHFHARGVRYVTLTHSENNHICDSSYAPEDERKWKGLSPFGKEVVREMNRIGMMIDVSHVSDDAFWQAAELTRAPLIASHSSCRHFTPGWERNMDDAMIRKLAETGGVIQINFGSAFLLEAAQKWSDGFWAAREAFVKETGAADESDEVKAFEKRYAAEHPPVRANVTDVADHIDHVVKIAGVDHVGFGSDFDGVGDSLPDGLRDVSQYPNLVRVLLERGYSDEEIRKICGENLLRVWAEVERVARP